MGIGPVSAGPARYPVDRGQNRGVNLPQLTEMPEPQYVMAGEGHRIATCSWGDDADDTVVVVHGFASSTRDNWVATGWVRDLLAAGYRVLGIDQRGHGRSDKPHDWRSYGIRTLVGDIETVLDTYLIDSAFYVGYSLGARVGWEVVQQLDGRIERVVLGGVPDGIPLARLDLDQVREYVESAIPVRHAVTQNYIRLVERVQGNDVRALLALAEAMRIEGDPVLTRTPRQPVLFATGSLDAIIEGSRALAAACPQGRFVEIPDRHHFNAPGSRVFRAAALEFFAER